LLENLARRHPGSLELMREIDALKDRGYTNIDIPRGNRLWAAGSQEASSV
jgi:hypothetical protein